MLGNNMFVYCNNNPCCFTDSTGYLPLNYFAYARFDSNLGSSYINDQELPPVGDKRFGLVRVSHGGCGPIATYNALLSMGDHETFDKVLEYYNQHFFQLNFGGLAGTSPGMVAQYFLDHGYSVRMTNSPDEIDLYSQTADACILWYMFPAQYSFGGVTIDAFGAHFVEYSKEGAGYVGRNTSGYNGKTSFPYPSDYAYSGSKYYAVGIFIYK